MMTAYRSAISDGVDKVRPMSRSVEVAKIVTTIGGGGPCLTLAPKMTSDKLLGRSL